jgi:flavin-dependent dehydrogenase
MPEAMQSTLTFTRELPVRYETDVLVVGGGPAGVAAAMAAAKQGASVRLVESQNCLGGMGTAGMVPAFMQFTDGVNFLAGGVGEHILTALRESDGSFPSERDGDSCRSAEAGLREPVG